MVFDATIVAMSFLVGTLVGLTSMGGAALMTPFLILAVGVRPVLAVGTDLLYGAISKSAGAFMHWRQGSVDLRVVKHLALGSVPGGVLGFLLVQRLHQNGVDVDYYLRRAIGGVLVAVAILILVRSFTKVPSAPARALHYEKPLTIGWGALVGLAVGLTSVGSGSLIAPFLLALYPAVPSRVVGTDVFHAWILVSATALMHLQAGHVQWRLMPLLLAGSIPGVLLGSYLAPRLPARTLRVGLSLVLFATGVKLV
jgi:uncharacterized membrane protein YfcA